MPRSPSKRSNDRKDYARSRIAVLKIIRTGTPVSRLDLQRQSGLSAGTITQVTSDLIERGLVAERKSPSNGRGRPRTYLEIAKEGSIVVGANLTYASSLGVSFVDLTGGEVFGTEIPLPQAQDLRQFSHNIAAALLSAIDESGIAKADILRVGIGLPGIIDSNSGMLHFLMSFESAPVPFATIVSEAIGLSVTVENDCNGLARAEHWFGCAQDLTSFTLVNVSYSVTAARYAHGIPASGAHGFNPELGHMKSEFGAGARPCFCGKNGCVTAYSSMYGMLRGTDDANAVPFDLHEIDKGFSGLLNDAKLGRQSAMETFHGAGEHLGRMMANHINGTDPGAVVILVPHPDYRTLVEKAFNDALARYVMPAFGAATKVRMDTGLPNWRQMGIAALALERAYLTQTA